ncbi:MAG: tryptophan 7-halogenase [Pirellulales bacterium]|nr:tryptophan 7-halogenase [Pirellulales bacterium]
MTLQTSSREEFDIAILGAGPAGCAAAISAAHAGLHAVLIEGSQFPRFRPGESLHPGIQPLMAQLGCEEELLAAGFPRFAGIHVQWGAKPRFDEFGGDKSGPWLGFQARRADFDQLLLNRARQVGVEVFQPCRALHPIVSEHRVVAVETSEGTIGTRFIVDAAGGGHWLARKLGIPVCKCSPVVVVT